MAVELVGPDNQATSGYSQSAAYPDHREISSPWIVANKVAVVAGAIVVSAALGASLFALGSLTVASAGTLPVILLGFAMEGAGASILISSSGVREILAMTDRNAPVGAMFQNNPGSNVQDCIDYLFWRSAGVAQSAGIGSLVGMVVPLAISGLVVGGMTATGTGFVPYVL